MRVSGVKNKKLFPPKILSPNINPNQPFLIFPFLIVIIRHFRYLFKSMGTLFASRQKNKYNFLFFLFFFCSIRAQFFSFISSSFRLFLTHHAILFYLPLDIFLICINCRFFFHLIQFF